MATEGDRSLSSHGISIPQWMKQKIDSRLDFDQSSFSPPETGEYFLYIRYPRAASEPLDKIKTNEITAPPAPVTAPATTKKPDFSKHTQPCQQFISKESLILKPKLPPDVKIKSNGTDDGFKGEAAKCGSSVVKVAHQMVSRGLIGTEEDECSSVPKGFNPSLRRGSKSLPASPSNSPKSKRKITNNYFTGVFTDNENHHHGWILSGLLGKRESSLSRSVGLIIEEDPKHELTNSISSMSIEEAAPVEKKKPLIFKPKPSELREMNFWSPTSM